MCLARTVLRKVKPQDLDGPLKGLPCLLLLSPKELGFHGELQHPVPESTSPLSKEALKLLPAHKVEGAWLRAARILPVRRVSLKNCGAEFLPNCGTVLQFLVIQGVARGCGKDKAGVEPSIELLLAQPGAQERGQRAYRGRSVREEKRDSRVSKSVGK